MAKMISSLKESVEKLKKRYRVKEALLMKKGGSKKRISSCPI